jgi:hypothetical protein
LKNITIPLARQQCHRLTKTVTVTSQPENLAAAEKHVAFLVKRTIGTAQLGVNAAAKNVTIRVINFNPKCSIPLIDLNVATRPKIIQQILSRNNEVLMYHYWPLVIYIRIGMSR